MNVSSFSTSDFRPKDRVEVWSEQIWSAIGRLNTETEVDEDFSGSVQFGDAGVIKLCRVAVGPHRVERTPELIRRDDRGLLKVVFQLKGCALMEQRGKQLLLSPGEWTIYDASVPYSATNTDSIELLAMLVPRDKLMNKNLDVSRYLLQRYSSTVGLGRLVRRFMRSFLDDMPALAADSGPNLIDAAIELVQLAVFEHLRSCSVLTTSDILKERIKTYINRHLRDPEFSIEMIADAMNCSKRYLHKTFREDHETLSHYLWNARLDRCRADLLDPQLQGKSITLIAFSWGFNNAAHFSRCFKTRFGVTPSLYRLSGGALGSSVSDRESLSALDLGLKVARTA
jgi:AraC-like DNA-binding protein